MNTLDSRSLHVYMHTSGTCKRAVIRVSVVCMEMCSESDTLLTAHFFTHFRHSSHCPITRTRFFRTTTFPAGLSNPLQDLSGLPHHLQDCHTPLQDCHTPCRTTTPSAGLSHPLQDYHTSCKLPHRLQDCHTPCRTATPLCRTATPPAGLPHFLQDCHTPISTA